MAETVDGDGAYLSGRKYNNVDGLRYDEVEEALKRADYLIRRVSEDSEPFNFGVDVLFPYKPAARAIDGLVKKITKLLPVSNIADKTLVSTIRKKIDAEGEENFHCFARVWCNCRIKPDEDLVKLLQIEHRYALPLKEYTETTLIYLGYASERSAGG